VQGVPEGYDQTPVALTAFLTFNVPPVMNAVKSELNYAMVGGARGSFIGPVHRAAIRLDNLAVIAAGCFSRDAAVNAATGAELGIDSRRVYPDWRSLIAAEKDRVDFVSICTPNDTHYPIAKCALEAGMNVMCEKPLALSLAEANDLKAVADRKKLILAVPFTYSGYPMVKVARDMVKTGELGKICKVVIEYQQGSFRKIDFSKPLDKRNSWKMDPNQSGPSCVVADIGVHAAHLAEYITGLTIEKVSADLSSFAPGNVLDDDATVMLRFDGGAKGVITTSKIATGEENGLRLRIYGEKASLHWDVESGNYLRVKTAVGPERIYKRNASYVKDNFEIASRCSRLPSGHHEGFIEAFANHYSEFCAAVRGESGRDFPGVIDGCRTMAFVDAVMISNREDGKWIAL
jgi:predicted dehydrogenase